MNGLHLPCESISRSTDKGNALELPLYIHRSELFELFQQLCLGPIHLCASDEARAPIFQVFVSINYYFT